MGSPFAQLLSGLNDTFSDPSSAGLTGFAQGLLQASAPHMMTPVSGGQALGMGAQASQQYQGSALQNAMARLSIPMQAMKVQTFRKALQTLNDPKASPSDKAAARALAANLISPGMGPSMLANSPAVQGAKEQAVQGVTPHAVGPGQRLVTGGGAPIVGAQGALPTGTTQGPGGAITPLPGALPAIAGASGAQAGGAAAATFPFQQALKASGYFKRSPGEAGGFNLPRPPVFNPGLPSGYPQQPSPLPNPAAAQAASRQRQMAIAQALRGQGAPAPGAPPQAAPNASPAPQQPAPSPQMGAPPVPPQGVPAPTGGGAPPAASPAAPAGGGLVSPGLTPSQVTGQQVAQKLATEQLAGDVTAGQEAQQRIASLEELNAVAGKLQTGPGTEARLAVQRALASVPGAIGQQAGQLSTITNAQIFNKTALNLSLQTVSSAGQTAYNSLETVVHAFPELAKTNMANAVVTGSLLATARYQADKGKFAATWQQQNQGMGFVPGKGTAEAAWTKQAPFMAYFMNSLPPEAQKALIQKAQTNRTLRAELVQAAQGQRWLAANGF